MARGGEQAGHCGQRGLWWRCHISVIKAIEDKTQGSILTYLSANAPLNQWGLGGAWGGSQCLLSPLPQGTNYTNTQDTTRVPPHPPALTAAAVAVAFQLHALSPRGLRGLAPPWPSPPDCPEEPGWGPGEMDEEEGSRWVEQEGRWEGAWGEGPPDAVGVVGGGGDKGAQFRIARVKSSNAICHVLGGSSGNDSNVHQQTIL